MDVADARRLEAIAEFRRVEALDVSRPGASEGTKRGREELLQLRESYALQWEDYSRPADGSYGKFRYLVLEVKGDAAT